MELKTCLQFDEGITDGDNPTDSAFNPELCLFLPSIDALIYAEGPFLLSDNDESFPTMEFTSKICLIKEVSIGKDKYLVLVIGEGSGVAILDLKNFKLLAQFIDTFPFKIVQVNQSPQSQQVFLLTDTPSLLRIDNFVLFTRLSPELLKTHFESGQVIKEFHFPTHENMVVKDFLVLEHQKGQTEFMTVGQNQMISWWKFLESSSSQGDHHSILNYFFTKPQPKDQKDDLKILTLNRFLNEPDRTVDKILTSSGNLVLLEDSSHGRLLLLDSEHSIIVRTFKGYRNCSAFVKQPSGRLLIWSGNRFTLEEWDEFPFGDSRRPLINDAIDSSASFDFHGNFFLYSRKSHQLKLYN